MTSTRVIGPGHDEWPEYLAQIPDPPPQLFVRGEVLPDGERTVAIVGTRRPTAAGVDAARTFARGLSQAGFAIVSGLAVGIDAIAHEATLEAGGHTVAVLGCGLEQPYPKRNLTLRQKIENRGTVITEYPSEVTPSPDRFPKRNRIIAGLATAVIVVEGGLKSGARITAERALDYDRSIFAVPGSLRNPMAATPNALIRAGQAALVTDVKHITDELAPGLVWQSENGNVSAVALGEDERRVILFLEETPVTVDVLCRGTGFNFGESAIALSRLEVRGMIRRTLLGYQLTESGLRLRASC
jgi:DNA processing protein